MRQYLAVLLAATVVSVAACGKSDKGTETPSNPPKPGTDKVEHSLTPEERAKYCFVQTATEPDETRTKTFLDQLEGAWEFIPVRPTDNRASKTFTFSQHDHRSEVSYGHPPLYREQISYRKICVSKALGQDAGEFAGYRIVEMMADNNEGGVAFAAKFSSTLDGSDSPRLLMSERVYERWAARDPLVDESSILKDKVFEFVEKK